MKTDQRPLYFGVGISFSVRDIRNIYCHILDTFVDLVSSFFWAEDYFEQLLWNIPPSDCIYMEWSCVTDPAFQTWLCLWVSIQALETKRRISTLVSRFYPPDRYFYATFNTEIWWGLSDASNILNSKGCSEFPLRLSTTERSHIRGMDLRVFYSLVLDRVWWSVTRSALFTPKEELYTECPRRKDQYSGRSYYRSF
jgi:hypothetical protein